MIDEDGDIKQPLPIWDLGVVVIAAVFTACIIGLWFFKFTVPAEKTPSELSVGLGAGSTIHSPVQNQPAANPPAHP